jgi:hypothetical protein
MNLHRFALPVVATLLVALAAPARAQLVQNGDFETTTNGSGQLGYNTNATGWTTTGYNFLFTPGSADTTGVTGQYGNLQLWGPNNGSANGLPATSPTGGNYIGADGDFDVGPIQQTITGLVAGQQYTLGFWWAGAQQQGYTGPTTEQFAVSFGLQTQDTAVANNASEGFTGWMHQDFTFTADGTSDVLSFLAIGTPAGVPPFSLLDGVTLSAVPEPSDLILLGGGIAMVAGLAWRRRQRGTAAAA